MYVVLLISQKDYEPSSVSHEKYCMKYFISSEDSL